MGTLHHVLWMSLVAAEEATHEAGAAAHGGGGSILAQLGIQFPLIIAQAVGFLALLFILRAFLYRPVLGMLSTREEEIRARSNDADEARAIALKLQREYETRMAQAEAEARDRIQDGIREGQAMRAELLAQAQQERDRIIQQGHQEIREEREKMVYVVRETVANMAVDAAGKIIARSMDENTHRALVQEFLAALPAGEKRA